MALYAPTNLQPEFITIDASINQPFTWTPSFIQYGYRLYIYLATTGVLQYDSGLVVSSTPSHTLVSPALGDDRPYYWILRVYSDVSTYVTSESIFFQTGNNPHVSLTVSSTVTTQNLTLTALYTTSAYTNIQKYKFILYDSSDNVIEDSGYIYSYNTTYTFSNLVNATSYKVECIVVDQNDLSATSGKKSFTTGFSTQNALNYMDVTANDCEGYNEISWERLKQKLAVVHGTSSYVAGKVLYGIHLEEGSYLEITDTLPEDWTITLWIKISDGFTGDIVTLNGGDYRVFFDGERFGFAIGDYITAGERAVDLLCSESLTCSESLSLRNTHFFDDFFLIGIKYGRLIIKNYYYMESIY